MPREFQKSLTNFFNRPAEFVRRTAGMRSLRLASIRTHPRFYPLLQVYIGERVKTYNIGLNAVVSIKFVALELCLYPYVDVNSILFMKYLNI